MWTALVTVLQALLGSAFKALLEWKQDQDRMSAHKEAAVNDAARQTQEAMAEIAARRADAPEPSSDPDELARELRQRKSQADRA